MFAARWITMTLVAPVLWSAEFQDVREQMVREQIEARGIRNPTVLAAMRKTPRHLFVPASMQEAAYEDHPLSIGHGQTISQPYIVALMTELLDVRKTDRVLEIGTGSGYQAAVLSELAKEVYTIEIVPELARESAAVFQRLLRAGVIVRPLTNYGMADHLRVTVGLPAENARFLAALGDALR